MASWPVSPIVIVAAQEATRSVWDGVYTNDQAKRGEALYARECGSCHGDMLTGGERRRRSQAASFCRTGTA